MSDDDPRQGIPVHSDLPMWPYWLILAPIVVLIAYCLLSV